MTTSRDRTRGGLRLLVVAAALTALTTTGAGLGPAGLLAPAQAASRVEVANDAGSGARADIRYRTRLSLTGTGFQSVRNGFGGVYVMFGWVEDPRGGSWKPSRGGLTGRDYRYVPDSEDTAANAGYLRFVAFPGSSTAGEAHTVLDAQGRFRVDLTVPGPVFQSLDREGRARSVDCRRVTCGVITIGAHGVKSPANETFTPVAFGEVYGQPPAGEATTPSATPAAGQATPPTGSAADAGTGDQTVPRSGPGAGPGSGPGSGPESDPGTGAPLDETEPVVVTDRATAVAGRALVFTATGFVADEQVVAVLDDGRAALTTNAGSSGEVVGALQLPLEAAGGTHELRVVGAASGRTAVERFAIQAAEVSAASDVEPVAAEQSTTGLTAPAWAGPLFLAAAAALLVVSLGVAQVRRRRTAATEASA